MTNEFMVAALIVGIIIAVVVVIIKILPFDFYIEPASRRAGKRGRK